MKVFLVLFFGMLASGYSQILQEGSCPQISVVQDFNPLAYSGLWYEVAAYPEVFEAGGECPTAKYSVLEDGTLAVTNSMVVGSLLVHVEGTAQQVGTEGVVQVSFDLNGVKTSSPLYILETDYTSYAVAFACRDNEDGTRHISSWILSRERDLSAAARAAVEALVQSVDGLDEELFIYKKNDENACSSIYSAGYD